MPAPSPTNFPPKYLEVPKINIIFAARNKNPNENMTLEQAKARFLHSLNVKKEMIKEADERLERWQTELNKTGKVSFC